MKALSAILALSICSALFFSCGPTHVVVQSQAPAPPPPPPPDPAPPVSYQSFYDELSPYGTWIDYPGYGYVWRPDVDQYFKPYATNGHWVYTDEGWTWASDYEWGWAAFHYGRWFFDNANGWMWIPGNEWAPAWVSWRTNSDYYGWAPLGPNIVVSQSYSYNPPANYWCFVPHQYVTQPHINNYYVNESRNVTIINNTTVINNYTNVRVNNTTINNTTVNNTTINNRTNVYVSGPDPGEVGRVTGTTIRPVPIRNGSRPGVQSANGQLNIYRPVVNAAPAAGQAQRIAPARVTPLRDLPAANRNTQSSNNTGSNQSNNFNRPPANNNQPAANNNGATNNPTNNNGFNRPATNNGSAGQPVNNAAPNNPRPSNNAGNNPPNNSFNRPNTNNNNNNGNNPPNNNFNRPSTNNNNTGNNPPTQVRPLNPANTPQTGTPNNNANRAATGNNLPRNNSFNNTATPGGNTRPSTTNANNGRPAQTINPPRTAPAQPAQKPSPNHKDDHPKPDEKPRNQ